MTTTPADLLSAASRVLGPSWLDERRELADDLLCAIYLLAEHVKSTVHTDDDEPVTVEWLRSIGGEDRRNNSVPSIQFSGDSNVVLRYYPKLDVWHVSGSTWKPKNRGQLRHLLAGLGMGGGK